MPITINQKRYYPATTPGIATQDCWPSFAISSETILGHLRLGFAGPVSPNLPNLGDRRRGLDAPFQPFADMFFNHSAASRRFFFAFVRVV